MANNKGEAALPATLKVRFKDAHVHRGTEYAPGAVAELSRDDTAMLLKGGYAELAKDSPGYDANGSPVH